MALTSDKPRAYLAGVPEIDSVLPIAAGQTIYNGAALELNASGYIENASGAGTFAGFALESSMAVTGESAGDRSIHVRLQGVVELTITTDSPAQTHVGSTSVTVEATDNDTFRLEPGTSITGQTVGKIMRLVGPQVVAVSFKASTLVA